MKLRKRAGALAAALVLGISLVGCQTQPLTPQEEQARFDDFIQNDFVQSMESSYWSASQFLEHPENFGVDTNKTDTSAESYFGAVPTQESIREMEAQLRESQKEFQSFHRDLLTREQQDTYDIYQYQLELAKEANQSKFQGMEPLFSSMQGIHYNLSQLSSLITLRTEEDVKKLLELMKSVPAYVDTVIAYTKEQEKQGLMMIDFDTVIQDCKTVLEAGTNSSSLLDFQEKIASLNLEKEKTSQYQKQIKDAYTTYLIPAYQTMVDALTELKNGSNSSQGLSSLKNGKEYYELIFQQKTGSERSIEETKELLENQFQDLVFQAQNLALKRPDLATLSLDKIKTKYTDYNSAMEDLLKKSKSYFPAIQDLTYEVRTLSPEQNNDGIAGFYVLPALDNTQNNQIFINPNFAISSMEMFELLTHEGVPGHMYQFNYIRENIENPWRNIVSFLGFTEGYAQYASYFSYRYLTDLDPDLTQWFQLNSELNFCLSALADIGIHYEGWTIEDLQQKLGLLGDTAEPVYQQIRSNPGAFLSYGVGLLEIQLLRDQAETALGDQFQDKAFHEALLKSGSVPFFLSQQNITEYIEQTLASEEISSQPAA